MSDETLAEFRLKSISEVHCQATFYMVEAFIKRHKNESEEADRLLHMALSLEATAITVVAPTSENEPTRATLCLTAAIIAYQLEYYKLASSYCRIGMSGYPEPQMFEKLGAILALCDEQEQQKAK